LWWVPSKKGVFKVKSYYSLTSTGGRRFPWKSVWRTQAPLRAAFFVWTAALNKILTQDNLRKRHVIVINRCCMCKKIDLQIISFSTATWLLLCGILSSIVSVYLGLCQDGLLTCLHVGGHLVDQGVLLFGKWHLFVSSGAFGGKETRGALKTWKEP